VGDFSQSHLVTLFSSLLFSPGIIDAVPNKCYCSRLVDSNTETRHHRHLFLALTRGHPDLPISLEPLQAGHDRRVREARVRGPDPLDVGSGLRRLEMRRRRVHLKVVFPLSPQRAILNFAPGPQGCNLAPSFTPRGEHSLLFRRMEGQTENFTPRDNLTPRGLNSPPGANFAPGDQSLPLGAK
jgi:hypothetical protein